MNAPKHCILIADDEVSYRDILSTQLANAAYEVVVTANGEEAIERLGKSKIDLALLDIRMPKRDGIQVLEYIKHNCPGTKAIMLTGFADLEVAMEAKELGAYDFISKPFALDDLLATVKEALSE
jgi:two-component system response regulator PilR (NtrC family)